MLNKCDCGGKSYALIRIITLLKDRQMEDKNLVSLLLILNQRALVQISGLFGPAAI